MATQNERALQYALGGLQGYRAFMLEDVKKNGYALQYASAKLKGDRDFMLKVVKQTGPIIFDDRNNLPEEFMKDLRLRVDAWSALVNDPILREKNNLFSETQNSGDEYKEYIKSQLEDVEHKYYKDNIWKRWQMEER